MSRDDENLVSSSPSLFPASWYKFIDLETLVPLDVKMHMFNLNLEAVVNTRGRLLLFKKIKILHLVIQIYNDNAYVRLIVEQRCKWEWHCC